MNTKEMIERLRAHYIEPGAAVAGGTFAAEVGVNGKFGASSRCDALYAGYTSASGRILIGHEVKVSRADWRHELDSLGKADYWADNCHAWYLVAPSTDIIPVEEVPAGWGLMVPNPRAKRRMEVKVRAAVHAERVPSWDAMRSFMARVDTLRAAEINATANEAIRRERERLEDDFKKRVTPANHEAEQALRTLTELEEAMGVKIAGWGRDTIRPEVFARAVSISRELQGVDAGRRWGTLREAAETARDVAERLTDADKAIALLRDGVPA